MKNYTRPQKIILVITKSNWGGAQKYVYELACELHSDKNFDVSVMAGGNGEMVHRLKEKNIKIIEIPHAVRDISVIKDIKTFFQLLSLFIKERPDIVHLNSSKISGLGALAGRLGGIKHIIFTAHGWAFNEERHPFQKKIIHLLYLVTILLSHKTICVSRTMLKVLKAPHWLKKRCVVIHNGVTPATLKPQGAFFAEKNITKKEKVAIVSIGELHKSKGFDLAIEYLSQLKNLSWEWHILGEGQERQNLEKEIREYNLENRIFLHGHTTNAMTYLDSFDIFFLPSRTEGLAYVAIEAIQTNLPIISSDAGGLPEILEKDKGSTLIQIKNSETVQILNQILSKEINRIPNEDRKQLREEFSFHHMFEKTKEVYLL